MQRLEVSCAVRRLYRSLGVRGLICSMIISAVPIRGTTNPPIFYHSDTTKDQLLESQL